MRKIFTFTHAQRRRMAQRWLLVSFVVGAAAVTLPSLPIAAVSPWAKSGPGPLPVVQGDMTAPRAVRHAECSDFDNQWEAQAYLQTRPAADTYLLDDDRDGVACESLP